MWLPKYEQIFNALCPQPVIKLEARHHPSFRARGLLGISSQRISTIRAFFCKYAVTLSFLIWQDTLAGGTAP
jgi:hypothetical protein